MPVLSSRMKAPGNGSVCSTDQVTVSGSVSARTALMQENESRIGEDEPALAVWGPGAR